MDYQVWTKDEYADTYIKVDCGDPLAAKRVIDEAVRKGGEPILTVEVPYELSIKIGEAGIESKKSKAKPDKGTGAPGKGEVRSGDLAAIPEFDQGSRDSEPGDSVPSK